MFAASLTTITLNIIFSNYNHVIMASGTFSWVLASFINELRCVKLQEKIDKLYGNN
jgi:hypothetical protein